MSIFNKFILALIAFILVINISVSPAQNQNTQINQNNLPGDKNSAAITKIDGSPVILGDTTLFVIKQSVGSFSPQERSQAVTNRLEIIAQDTSISLENLKIIDETDTTNIVIGDKLLITITEKDAQAADTTRQEIAKEYLEKISKTIALYREERSFQSIIRGLISSLIATLVMVIISRILNQIFPIILHKLQTWQGMRIPALRIQNIELLPAARVSRLVTKIFKIIYFIILLSLIYIYLFLVLGFFPWSRQLSNQLVSYF